MNPRHPAAAPAGLSVVIPLYDEADNVRPLVSDILQALNGLGPAIEIVLVDDGSRDATFAIASDLASRDRRIRLIRFRRNYGQTAALAAGIDAARGEIIVTMDGDLQNDPADIPLLLEKIHEGYDVAAGWRHRREDSLLTRTIPSKVANWLVARVSGVPLHDTGCTLRAYRAGLIKRIPLYADLHRFIPAVSALAGCRIAEIRVRHRPRRAGRSKYGLSRVHKVLLDLFTVRVIRSVLSRPLAAFVLPGVISLAVAVLILGGAALDYLRTGLAPGLPLLGSGLLFGALAAVLFFWGVLAELVYRTGDVRQERFSELTVFKLPAAERRGGGAP